MIGADLKGSEVKLWQLVEERTKPGADRKVIDQRIWDLFGQEWAIMFTDLSGFSRHVAAFGIIHFLQVIHEQKRLLLPIVAANDGIVVKVEADSFLILFRKAATAVRTAVDMQRACYKLNKTRAPEDQVLLCIGLGYGRVLRIGDEDVYGQEVNLASKLGEDTAKANEILLTEAAVQAAGEILGTKYVERAGSGRAMQLQYKPE
ncbi:MAG: adenylate/guanylate cyclase domain-containing protein [Deltaproteobacteria bacterium]|nr:adenylate/guanylate cyclase domain-containing protein [Deltaproteobacteria bacterium]